jgi:hypothetical protein
MTDSLRLKPRLGQGGWLKPPGLVRGPSPRRSTGASWPSRGFTRESNAKADLVVGIRHNGPTTVGPYDPHTVVPTAETRNLKPGT